MMESNAERLIFCPLPAHKGERLDKWLTMQLPQMTRSELQRLMTQGSITVDGRTVDKNYKMRLNEQVVVEIPPPQMMDTVAEDIPLDIVFEDDALLVVNKPKGMVVHPAIGNYTGTLVNGLLYHCKGNLSGINGMVRPGIVHRIDKNTSGLLVVAKSDIAHQSLSLQLSNHSLERCYEAVVYSNLKQDEGTICAPLGRHPLERKRMAVTQKNSREATTHYKVLERFGAFTHVQLHLETGRTHQIRVHMAYIGNPVAGDEVYGPKKVITQLNGQCLHAKTLGFTHPVSGERLIFESPLPTYFTDFLAKLQKSQ